MRGAGMQRPLDFYLIYRFPWLLTCCSLPLTKPGTRGRGTVFVPKSGSPVPLLCSGCFVLLCTDTVVTSSKGGRLDSPGGESPAASSQCGLETSSGGYLQAGFWPAGGTCSHSGLKKDWLVVVGSEVRRGAWQPVPALTPMTASWELWQWRERWSHATLLTSQTRAPLSSVNAVVWSQQVTIRWWHRLEIFCCCFT